MPTRQQVVDSVVAGARRGPQAVPLQTVQAIAQQLVWDGLIVLEEGS